MLNLAPATIISRIITLIIAFTLHEFAHATTANAFGDDTPRLAGRLSLNPIVHLDMMGTIMLLFAGFGWAKPVPINPYVIKRKNKAGLMLVSIAGPLMNLLLAIIAAIPLRFRLVEFINVSNSFLPTFGQFLLEFVFINIALFLFNLIPLAPLDGEKVLSYFLPASFQNTYAKIHQYGPILLLAIAVVGPMIGFDLIGIIIGAPLMKLTRFLVGL